MLNVFDVDVVAEFVMGRNVGVTDLDFTRVIEASEFDGNIGVVGPFLELPLHPDQLVLHELLVDALDR